MAESTTCAIAGGGPAGMVLGLLLARSGIDVVVLEKHGDFLRDFRGDTIHPSTLEVLDELGLGERFAQLPQRHVPGLTLVTDDEESVLADLGELRHGYPYIAMVPQWDFLTMVAEEAKRYPHFDLRMRAEAFDLVRDGPRVAGLRYRDDDRGEHEIRAPLTVAADGRHCALRGPAGLALRELGAPMDVAWFRLPRVDTDRTDSILRLGTGRAAVGINRTTYWQLGWLVPKGGYATLGERGIESLRRDIDELLPFLADRTAGLEFDAISVLEVQVNRLRRWHRPGFLAIGDAAHAMSPIGGVGINLAIQDAVATANRLVAGLRRGAVAERDLAAVQRRRTLPTVATQRFQVLVQNRVVAPTVGGGTPAPAVPLLLRVARRVGPARRLVARFAGYGVRPEHVRTEPASP